MGERTRERLEASEAAGRRTAGREPLLAGAVTVSWNAYRREFTVALDDHGLGLEKVASLRSKTVGRMALQLEALTRSPNAEGVVDALAAAQKKLDRPDNWEIFEAVDYRHADPEQYTHEIGRFPVDLTARAVRRVLDGGFASPAGDEAAPRVLAFGLAPLAERGAFDARLARTLDAQSPEHNRRSAELTRCLRDEIMASPGFAQNDQYRRAVDMLELGRRALTDALRRQRALDPRQVDTDFVPLMADAAQEARGVNGPARPPVASASATPTLAL